MLIELANFAVAYSEKAARRQDLTETDLNAVTFCQSLMIRLVQNTNKSDLKCFCVSPIFQWHVHCDSVQDIRHLSSSQGVAALLQAPIDIQYGGLFWFVLS